MNNAQPKWWKMMAKMRSRRHTLDWWKCYLDSCMSWYTFFVREFLKNTDDRWELQRRINTTQEEGLVQELSCVAQYEKGIVNLLSILMLLKRSEI